jgi:hypothetical protein
MNRIKCDDIEYIRHIDFDGNPYFITYDKRKYDASNIRRSNEYLEEVYQKYIRTKKIERILNE